jgi:hypothetical protein
MFATDILPKTVAAAGYQAAGTPLMDYDRSIHQPAARKKLICGSRSFHDRGDPSCPKQLIPMARQDKGGSMAP